MLFCSVGAVGKDGLHASYSSTGAALFLSAPGGDYESFTNNVVAKIGGGCLDATAGTSFATPVAAGVVALILQANPDLTWRDVQGILATTSQKTDADDPSWSTNAAGIPHSYLYGFGVIDADAAVTAALAWENYSSEVQLLAESGQIDLTIPEYPNGPVSSTVSLEASDVEAESVVVYLNITHSSRGDLDIVLISPSGTESLLHPGQRPENTQADESWQLMTVRNWNEPVTGDWTLGIIDQSAGDLSNECIDIQDWSIIFDFEIGEIGCAEFLLNDLCADGDQGPAFFDIFPEITGITDPFLNDENGVGPADACCACGGGTLASSTPDVLKSWRLIVYGHGLASTGTSTSDQGSEPTVNGQASSTPIKQGLRGINCLLVCLLISATMV